MSYIGTSPAPEGYLAKYEYTATAGQTVFACNYEDRVDVFINGVLLSDADFTATNGTSITLTSGATVGDIVQIDGFSKTVNYFNGISRSQEFVATAGQTNFTISYDVGFAQVFLNGVRLDAADYTATSGTEIVLTTGATAGDTVFVEAFGTFASANHYTKPESDSKYVQSTDIGTTVLAPDGDGSQLTGLAASFADLTDTTVSVIDPTVTTNPTLTGHLWINKTTGDQYVCTDNTTGANVWTNTGTGDTNVVPIEYYAATGGTITTVGDYKYHTFTSSGTFTVTTAGNAPSGGIDYVVVAGGGGAGTDNSGGGGAGGYLGISASAPSAAAYTVVVGAGGAGSGSGGNNGSSSSVLGTSTVGGGHGSQWSSCVGGNGGSGGGSCSANNNPGDGTVGQGHDGGTAYNDGRTGGGGGAGSVGSNASSAEGGDGGAGLQWLNGTYYAGGGGGCGEGASLGGGEGQHGGGNGANGRDNGANGTTSGTANTGGGSGGPRLRNGTFNGGSGTVVLRYKWQN